MKGVLVMTVLALVVFSSCKKNNPPDQVLISSIVVTEFPMTNDAGDSWDDSTEPNPDLYVTVAEGNEVVWTNPTHYDNAESGTDFSFVPNEPIAFSTLTNECQIDFYDWESGVAHEWMGGVEFTFDEFKEDAKEELLLTSGTFSLTLFLEWGNQ